MSERHHTPKPERDEARAAIREEWATERARVGLQLLGHLPAELQAEGLRLWSALERAHEQLGSRLERSWQTECDFAHLDGERAALDRLQAELPNLTNPEAQANTPQPTAGELTEWAPGPKDRVH